MNRYLYIGIGILLFGISLSYTPFATVASRAPTKRTTLPTAPIPSSQSSSPSSSLPPASLHPDHIGGSHVIHDGDVHDSGRATHTGTHFEWIRNVHIVYMTHLDIGFTDYANNVCDEYFNSHFPEAIALAQQLRARGEEEKFVYTSHPWLLLEYLDGTAGCGSIPRTDEQIRLMEDAILAGDVTWHAHAFSMFTPMLTSELMAFSLTLCETLDNRFNQTRKIAASQKDTMGHSISSVPILAKAGIKALHIGANLFCTAPDVPPAFMWKHEATNTQLLVMMYNKPTGATPCTASFCVYGGDVVVPGFRSALVYHFTLDNSPPPTQQEILDFWATIHERYPNATLKASSLDAFVNEVLEYQQYLPVVRDEMGDTWSYGIAADPYRVSAFRAISRILPTLPSTPDVLAYQQRLLKLPEHNWGLSTSKFLSEENYSHHWANEQFHQIRNNTDIQMLEDGWTEARKFLQPTKNAGSLLKATITSTLQQLVPRRPDLSEYEKVPIESPSSDDSPAGHYLFSTPLFVVGFNYSTGAVDFLMDKQSGLLFANSSRQLANYTYQTFAMDEFDRFNSQFNPNCGVPCADFSKAGMEHAAPVSAQWSFEVVSFYRPINELNDTFLVQLRSSATLHDQYGAPAEIWIKWRFEHKQHQIQVELSWFEKSATRLAEASWLSFSPLLPTSDCNDWRFDVQGNEINPARVVGHGAKHLHAVGDAIHYQYSPKNADTNNQSKCGGGTGTVLTHFPSHVSTFEYEDKQTMLQLMEHPDISPHLIPHKSARPVFSGNFSSTSTSNCTSNCSSTSACTNGTDSSSVLCCLSTPVLTSFDVISLDAALVSPGSMDYLLNFDDSEPDCSSGGMHWNLHNNLWGTAFNQWYSDDAYFRFTLLFRL